MKSLVMYVLIGLAGYGLFAGGNGLYLNNLQSQAVTKLGVLEQWKGGTQFIELQDGYFYPAYVYEFEANGTYDTDGKLSHAIVPYISENQLQDAINGYPIEPTVYVKFPLSMHSRYLDSFDERIDIDGGLRLTGYTTSGLAARLTQRDKELFAEFEGFIVNDDAFVVDFDDVITPMSENLFTFLLGFLAAIGLVFLWTKTNRESDVAAESSQATPAANNTSQENQSEDVELNTLQQTVIESLLSVAVSDNELDVRETELIRSQIQHLLGLNIDDDVLLAYASRIHQDMDTFFENLNFHVGSVGEEDRIVIFRACVGVAAADGKIEGSEHEHLVYLAEALKVDPRIIDEELAG